MKNIRQNLKYILPVLIVIMVLGLVLSRVYQPESSPPEPEVSISTAEAIDYIGTVAKVCGTVSSTDYLSQVGGEPTFINFGHPHPNQLFTAVIWGNNRNKWSTPPERHYEGREICVSGRIEMHKDKPQIIVESPEQIVSQR